LELDFETVRSIPDYILSLLLLLSGRQKLLGSMN
jgi:hypothetical protein